MKTTEVVLKTPEPEPVRVPDPEPVKEPVQANPNAQLFGAVRLTMPGSLGNRAVFVRNNNTFAVNNCEVRLPNNMVFKLKRALAAKDEVKLSIREFRPDPRPEDPQFKADWAAVYCKEGTGYWKTTYDRR